MKHEIVELLEVMVVCPICGKYIVVFYGELHQCPPVKEEEIIVVADQTSFSDTLGTCRGECDNCGKATVQDITKYGIYCRECKFEVI